MSSQSKINKMYEFLASVGTEYQFLPHPRRWSLPSARECLVDQYQEIRAFIDPLARDQAPSMDLSIAILGDEGIARSLAQDGGSFESTPFIYMIRRHQIQKAPIFTVSGPLNKMLADTGVKSDIPARYLTPPFKTSYVEFESAEQRTAALRGGANPSKYVEGCYVQESTVDDLSALMLMASPGQFEKNGLDVSKKTRVIDMAFTFSTYDLCDVDNRQLAYHPIMKYTLYIQDEDESLTKVIARQLQFCRDTLIAMGTDLFKANHDFDVIRDSVIKLSKTLLYLNLNIRDRVTESAGIEIDRKLESVGAKKRGKLERQAAKFYDRIVVGPKSYVPLADRVEEGEVEKGRKKPHFRRGYFGIRWIGSGEGKTPELVRVKEALINKDLMVEKTARDYDIF